MRDLALRVLPMLTSVRVSVVSTEESQLSCVPRSCRAGAEVLSRRRTWPLSGQESTLETSRRKAEGGARGEGSVRSFPGGWRRPCSRPAPRAGTASGAHVLAPTVVTPGDFLFQLYRNRDCDLK